MTVIEALQLPEVLAGTKWIALPQRHGAILLTMTLGVSSKGKLHWCDRYYDARAVTPTYLGTEAALTLPQLRGECVLIDPTTPRQP